MDQEWRAAPQGGRTHAPMLEIFPIHVLAPSPRAPFVAAALILPSFASGDDPVPVRYVPNVRCPWPRCR